ncbi:hypothetical protein BHE74_00029362 [Ensete ventricosum]|nr:hypothetical protein BHE74_00029362 [Ensete ventricosum]
MGSGGQHNQSRKRKQGSMQRGSCDSGHDQRLSDLRSRERGKNGQQSLVAKMLRARFAIEPKVMPMARMAKAY